MSAQAQPHHAAPATVESFDTIVIGGGQAGLSTGYHLSRCGVPFVILDANAHVGDSWRSHWDSMRLFTPARRDALPGMRFPAAKHAFPSGAEMGEYRNPRQLPDGDVLVVGAGTSGADIALELAAERHVTLSGELPAEIPFDIEGMSGRVLFPLLWWVWTHVLTYGTPVGRKALPKIEAGRQPLIRVKSRHLADAGVQLVPRTVGARDGLPEVQDGRTIPAHTIVWATGYRRTHEWIDLPVVDEHGDIACDHDGVAASEPGLFRVGREFLHAFNSHTVGGVGRDAERIAERIAALHRNRRSDGDPDARTGKAAKL